MVTGVPGQEGAEGNVAGKKKVKESMKYNLGKLLKYNAWLTRWSSIRVRSSYDRAMIELRADVELKDTIVVAMPKLIGEGFYLCTICVKYEWKPPRCASCRVFGHVLDECPKNIGSDLAKNLKNPSQATKGVLVGPNVGFKQVKQVYIPVSRKSNVSTSGNKKKDAVSRKEVSNSKPFDALNSVRNDVELGTNEGSSNSAVRMKLNLWTMKSASFLASNPSGVGYGTNRVLEQWWDTYGNVDYNYDPYDDDMYEGHEIPIIIQSICDKLDIKIMAFSVISISSDSSEGSVGMATAQVILFGTIPTTIPPTASIFDLPAISDDTPLIPTGTPTIPPIAPTIQYTSPFICIDSSNRDTSERPPSQDPYEVVVAQWRSCVAGRSSPPPPPISQILPASPSVPRRPAILVSPGKPIPIGRPYRTQPYVVHYSSSDQITLDDSSRDSSFDSSLEASSDSHSDTLSDSSSRHSSLGYAISDSPISPVRKALSPTRADLLPPRKRIRDFDSMMDLEDCPEEGHALYVPREMGLGVEIEDSYEPYIELDVDFDIQADIDAYFVYADKIAARGTYIRVEIETATKEEARSSETDTVEVEVDPRVRLVIDDDVHEPVREDLSDYVTTDGAVEVTYETLGDLVQRFHDHTVEILVHRIQVIESVQRFQGHRIVGVDLEVTTMTERIGTLEQDNTRIKGMLDVERQRVDRLQDSMSRVQRDLRQIRRFRFYDRMRVGRLEACARSHLGY
ncbi:hypothetical protein Tco_1191644 [Tanacetum coccineum]